MTNRRGFLQGSLGLGLVSLMGLGASVSSRAATPLVGWRMPDELAPHSGSYLTFGAQRSVWADWTPAVQACLGRLAKAIAKYEPVTVLCRAHELALAKRHCGTRNTRFVTCALDDIWLRDTGGCFVRDGRGQLGSVDFNFNGWGNKQAHYHDAYITSHVSYDARASYLRSELTGEGGGIEVDGEGTAILTESCWLNANRNPGWTRAEIEAELKALLGLEKIIWLPGIRGKDITDGHVDFYARFARPGVVVASLDNDPASYDYAVTREHLKILQRATDAQGRALQVHTLPPPTRLRRNQFTQNNPDFAPGYINFYPVNGAVIAPQFGDSQADGYCRDLLKQLYPERQIVQLDIDAIAAGGGGIHCVTLHCPT
ncbi:agmatine deiminase family protein [Atopomonas hussainii]|uniref:agmatine deiminase family protein n=1 Tax=Atopomonas hussainii TaxID=1429083 RepID=UPI0009002EF0|nr:agmatine deiminase family protein [Atopomonas hussainii]